MTISGNIAEEHWNVAAETFPAPGGFGCHIRVSHGGPHSAFEHEFNHSRRFRTEREAILDGLREGMIWIEYKLSKTIDV
jgi:hypothetical protein